MVCFKIAPYHFPVATEKRGIMVNLSISRNWISPIFCFLMFSRENKQLTPESRNSEVRIDVHC
jgi:hypothetical protein